jgi:DNA-binding NtrC family response regulator
MLPQPQPISDVPVALVIDDEAGVRALLTRMLHPDVCRVVEAGDGESGLRAIERDDPQVDLVLTDYVMPGLDGLDVLEVLAEHRPALPVAIVSAHAGSIYRVQRRRGGQLRVLQKPFSPEAVRALTVELINEARAQRQQAMRQRMYALEAHERNEEIREQNASLRARVDLVSAAWALHHARRPGG